MIYNQPVVKDELKRLESLIGSDDGRDVNVDIAILKKGLDKINLLLKGEELMVTIDSDMWEEAHHSLDRILKELKLEINEHFSNYDNYEFAILANRVAGGVNGNYHKNSVTFRYVNNITIMLISLISVKI